MLVHLMDVNRVLELSFAGVPRRKFHAVFYPLLPAYDYAHTLSMTLRVLDAKSKQHETCQACSPFPLATYDDLPFKLVCFHRFFKPSTSRIFSKNVVASDDL